MWDPSRERSEQPLMNKWPGAQVPETPVTSPSDQPSPSGSQKHEHGTGGTTKGLGAPTDTDGTAKNPPCGTSWLLSPSPLPPPVGMKMDPCGFIHPGLASPHLSQDILPGRSRAPQGSSARIPPLPTLFMSLLLFLGPRAAALGCRER